jgi:hypothetical protein
MSNEPVDLKDFTVGVLVLINECLKSILSAIPDPRLDREATMQQIEEQTLKAQEYVAGLIEAIHPADE